jgi:4-amino-4-deoxy-L-arabinose transferase-like glycosyltransferase
VPALLLSAPHGDNVEQLNWSHGAAWGYSKHPPLPTFLLRSAIDVFGRSATLTYALAMACVAAALFALWRCARELLDRRAALVALLLSSANYYLMGRGSFLNHNTVMLPFVALSALAVLRIVAGATWRAWLLLGLVQALGLLTKYQMGLVCGANVLALVAAGVHRRPGFLRHAALASGATLFPLVPHALWLASHQFSTFHYAGQSLLAQLTPLARLRGAGAFLGQQVGRLAPALIAAGIAWAIDAAGSGRGSADLPRPAAETVASPGALRALAAMALAPLAGIVLLTLGFGVAAQNHWGASTTLLIPLYGCAALPRIFDRSTRAAAFSVIVVHAGAIAWNIWVWAFNPGPHHSFAARPLAAMALDYWTRHASGKVPLVVGADWEGGSIAIYLPGQPAVVPSADWTLAPWVDPALARGCGALVIGASGAPLSAQASGLAGSTLGDPQTISVRDRMGRDSSVQLAFVAPQAGAACPSESR